jgi:murein DD-endopeptidase MepM/ murein hydrolase activator NlpD
MALIRVDVDFLRAGAARLRTLADGHMSIAGEALSATRGAPDYDGQFGPVVREAGMEIHSRYRQRADDLSDLARRLEDIAAAFEQADREVLQGLGQLQSELMSLLGQLWPSLSPYTLAAVFPIDEIQRLLHLGELAGAGGGGEEGDGPPWWLWIPPFTPIAVVWWLIDRSQATGPVSTPPATTTPTATPGSTVTPTPSSTSTPAATPTAVPSATPTAVPPNTRFVLAEAGLNLRDTPGGNVIVLLPYGSSVQLLGAETPLDGYTWQNVSTQDGANGWVAGDFLGETAPVVEVTSLDAAPLEGNSLYVSGYDYAETVDSGLHPGLDIWASDATLRANTDGEVYYYQTWKDDEGWHTVVYDPEDPEASEDLDGFGNYAVLESEVNGETYYQVFAHLDSFADHDQGEFIEAGTEVGTMGSTGNSSGPHVHWEIRRDDAVTIDDEGVHSFGSIYYPATEDELDDYFVDPDDFADWVEEE